MANPIKCPACKAIVIADEKNLQLRTLSENIKCPECQVIVIRARRVLRQAQERRKKK